MARLEEMLMKPYPCSLGDSLFDFKVPLCLKQVPRALSMHGMVYPEILCTPVLPQPEHGSGIPLWHNPSGRPSTGLG